MGLGLRSQLLLDSIEQAMGMDNVRGKTVNFWIADKGLTGSILDNYLHDERVYFIELDVEKLIGVKGMIECRVNEHGDIIEVTGDGELAKQSLVTGEMIATSRGEEILLNDGELHELHELIAAATHLTRAYFQNK